MTDGAPRPGPGGAAPRDADTEAAPAYGFLVPVDVYFDDLDSFGVVYNNHYGTLVERAWVDYWQERGVAFTRDWQRLGDGYNVARDFHIVYEWPIDRPGRYAVHCWTQSLGRTSLTYGFRVRSRDGATTYAHGTRTVIRLDPDTHRPTPWSERAHTEADAMRGPAS